MPQIISKKYPNFLAPDVLLMFVLALILDFGGVFCLLLDLTVVLAPVGLVISIILDVIGLAFFTLWILLVRGGKITGKASSVLRKLLKRVGLPALVEFIPVVGDIAFSWLITVYLEVKKNG